MKWIYYNDIERFVHVRNHSLIGLFWTHFSLNRGNFERTFVWSEVISSELLSDQRWFRAHFSLIIGNFEPTSGWSEAISSALQSDQRRIRAHFERTTIFERTLVLSEITSGWGGLIRGPTCLGRSDQRRFRAQPPPGIVCSLTVLESANHLYTLLCASLRT